MDLCFLIFMLDKIQTNHILMINPNTKETTRRDDIKLLIFGKMHVLIQTVIIMAFYQGFGVVNMPGII